MNETNEKAQISLHKITLLVGIMQRQISIDEAVADEDTERVRILNIAQNIDIGILRNYLDRGQQKTGIYPRDVKTELIHNLLGLAEAAKTHFGHYDKAWEERYQELKRQVQKLAEEEM